MSDVEAVVEALRYTLEQSQARCSWNYDTLEVAAENAVQRALENLIDRLSGDA